MRQPSAARPEPGVSGNGSLRSDRSGGLIGSSTSKNRDAKQAELLPKAKLSDKHWYAYDVRFGGETIVTNSRDPEHDLARALLARGIRGMVQIIDAKTGMTRSLVNIEVAAKRGVDSNLRTRPWMPYQPRGVDGYSPEEAEPLVRGAGEGRGGSVQHGMQHGCNIRERNLTND